MVIRELFDPSRDIYRTIEKVITYSAAQEQRLKAEIAEYVVTESIEDQTEKLLSKMQAAMDAGGQYEVGVWASGFYGSGKSSFTKYLGLAFDDQVTIDGQPFLKHLQDRYHKPQTRALLGTIAKRFPAAVVMLDLASAQVAGATLEVVSTVLYYRVLQWAGYSRNLKVAALERKLKKDGRYDDFQARFRDQTGEDWCDYQNDELVVDSLLPELAHAMYPQLFRTPQSFTTSTSEFIYLLNDRVQEILDIVRETAGKDYVLFVIDEVGQYVGSNQNKILDLQGLAENLKNIGSGRAWIFGTAQQTLTEDDPRAALNSPELYKLKDRFPISIDLESRDIREICYRRLLGKSAAGAQELDQRFVQYGQALRHNTKLQDAKYYDAAIDRDGFVNLYPFLPAHFDILLHLLGALAKSTGGIGLRSAIKVIQEVLIEGPDGRTPIADQQVGWLATTVTLFDALEKDIKRAFPSIAQAVGKVLIRFPDSVLHQEVAKTVAVLQILGNLPVTVHNVANLMHPAIDAAPRADAVKAAADALLSDPLVPLGERNGTLSFFSEKLNDIEQERAQLPLRSSDLRRIASEALREVFDPLPSARLHGSLSVTTGVKIQSGGSTASLAGEREAIQTIVELVDPTDYETTRTRLVDESRHKTSENLIYLLGRRAPETDDKVAEVYRSQRIVELHRNDPDQELKEYCMSQSDVAARRIGELKALVQRSLAQGSFLFRGETTAVDSLGADLLDAAKKHLGPAAEQVFHRYAEAPERVDTAVAEKFLRTGAGNLKAVTSQLDPLGLVQVTSGNPSIRTDHKALVSIRDYIDRNGTTDGKHLLDHFSSAPFGWSQDTLRYLIAALLVAGDIKLKVSGREVTVAGQQAIDALKTNLAFKPIGVALRQDKPPMEVLARAAQRLTDLIGDTVVPLEEDIGKAAAKHLPQFQHTFAPLAERLAGLELPGAERVRALNQQIADLLFTDASDAPDYLGREESALYDALKWAQAVTKSLGQGLNDTIKDLRTHQCAILNLPGSGVPGSLKQDCADALERLADCLADDGFYQHTADLNTLLTALHANVATAVGGMAQAQQERIRDGEQDLKRIPEWAELTQETQANALDQLAGLRLTADHDLAGLQRLISNEFDLSNRLEALKQRIIREGRERKRQRMQEEKDEDTQEGKEKLNRTIRVPLSVSSASDLDDLIERLQAIKAELTYYDEFELRIEAI
ncbi:BREX system P-loop protein BrxC [uncultured Thiodictyon sp.]|uniref:BREX system P-loop protein BrxC n=1 Tax=uncultured Thiodictyon sp. TaxID=1846217 RepID=UPI0025F3ED04|nr:BREX system P-loop protein BrxC [uncultured Thiodictyon sp.]